MSAPKHRANKLVKTEPRVQPAGRHVAGSHRVATFSIADLLREATVGNPFRPKAGA